MTRIEMEQQVASLLLEEKRLLQFNLQLSPDRLLLLKRLLYRLGLNRMSRNSQSPRRYSERINQDLRLFRTQVRSKHALAGSRKIQPNTPQERELLHDFAIRRGLKVKKSPYSYYDEQYHTFYHPTPENKAVVGEAYLKHGEDKVKFSEGKPNKFARPDEVTHNGLIHSIINKPEEATSRLAFADFLEENHIPGAHVVREHGSQILNGEDKPSRILTPLNTVESRVMILSPNRTTIASGGSRTRGYATLKGEKREYPIAQVASGSGGTRIVVAHRSDPEIDFHSTNRGQSVLHYVDVKDSEHLHNLTSDWPIWAQKEVRRITKPHLVPKKLSRLPKKSIQYAKAEKNRDRTHPLIEGFPLEHALRHLANDPKNSSTLRDTAKVVLTKGDTSGLWALNDLLQEHENPDGTHGHPLHGAYNWMSAADKIGLDAHTHRALTEAAEHERQNTPPPHHEEGTSNHLWEYRPEYMALRAMRGFGTRTHTEEGLKDYIHNRVKSLQPTASDKDIKESIKRHGYRASSIWGKEHKIDADDKSRALLDLNKKETPPSFRYMGSEEATRYARVKLQPAIVSIHPATGETAYIHHYTDNEGKRLGSLKLIPRENGKLLHITWAGQRGTLEGKNTLGTSNVMDIGRQLVEQYPNATHVSGVRVTGMREGNDIENQETKRPLPKKRLGGLPHKLVKYTADKTTVDTLMNQLNDPNNASHKAGLDNPLHGVRGYLADALDENGRGREASILRQSGQFIVPSNGRIHRGTIEAQNAGPIYDSHSRKQLVKVTYDGLHDPESYDNAHGFTYWFAEPPNSFRNPTPKWVWNPSDGEALDESELAEYHPHYQDYQPTQELEANHKLDHAELAFLRANNLQNARFKRKLPGKVVKYAMTNRSNFIDSLRRIKSSNQKAMHETAQHVAKTIGMEPTKILDALHDAPYGSVPGVAQAIYGPATPEQLHSAAAWMGLTANLPGVAVFHARDSGPDTLYRMRMNGAGLDIRSKLDRVGIKSRVLIPHRKGFDVIIPDKGNRLGNSIDQFAETHGLKVESSPGHFNTIGSSDQARAREMFRGKVAKQEAI